MAEYVEREKVLSKAAPVEGCFSDMISVYDVVMLPAADVAPVVHGRWIMHDDEFGLTCECSVCHIETMGDGNYCPNCGAKMDGGVD